MEAKSMILFDHSRIRKIEVFEKLQTNKGRVAFIFMVKDYMDYLRSRPHERPGYDEEIEKMAAIDFVKAVNGKETGWPLARQVVPEFQQPQVAFDHLHQPLRFVLEAVQNNITHPLPNVPEAQKVEEDCIWRKYTHTVQYLAYLAGEPLPMTPARQVEQATLLHNLSTILEVTKSAATKDGDLESGDEVLDDEAADVDAEKISGE